MYILYALLLLVLVHYSIHSELYIDRIYTRLTLLAYSMFGIAVLL
jgi:hypothetical protein